METSVRNILILASRIVIVDDDPDDIFFLKRFLANAGFCNVVGYSSGAEALNAIQSDPPDLIILDRHMPGQDGLALLQAMRQQQNSEDYLPIIMFTGDIDPGQKTQALRLGATDFLIKPGEETEVVLRVRSFLETRHLHRQVQIHRDELDGLVRERTSELNEARLEALERLARAAEFRDDDTGEHAKRVGSLSAAIARRLGCMDPSPHVLELAAPLHDIGKIGIPDAILLKEGRLTSDEFDLMRRHTEIGSKILEGSNSAVLKEAAVIAQSHHEKWDGSGYPSGLRGEAIPLSGRIVGVADVFDALTHHRPYKEAWTEEAAIDHIAGLSGTTFDPDVVGALVQVLGRRLAARPA